ITFPVALVGGILSGSRTVYFFLLAGIFNLLYVFIFSAGKGRKSFQVAIVVILILGVAGAVFFAGGTLKDRFSEGYSGDKTLYEKINGLTNGRLWMTQFTLNGIKDNFVPGIGTGNFTFYLAYKNYLPYKESGKGYLFDQSLNHYLQVFIENGIFGFILFCWFMVSLFRRADKKLLIGTILFSLLFNNFFWFPEAILLFWVVVAVSVKPGCVDGVGESDKKGVFKGFSFRKKEIIVVLGFLIFIGFNIVSFSSLHPGVWARESGIPYDYGFWYGEKDGEGNTFHWTKSESGVYLYLDGNGNSGEIKLVCGAPLGHLEGKEQRVEVYWRGDLYNEVVFKEN
ncbi:MAG: O-antigen ligase family protein, partial [bacterium]|nr:O-antigen ligase family protein [bacterium]